jgi:formate dehydrogenase major subunit
MEMNGFTWPGRQQVESYQALKDDGSTACGAWLYSGIFPRPGDNRASADPQGKSWSERKRYVYWDGGKGEWAGADTPDFEKTKSPDYRPDWGKDNPGMEAIAGDNPFIMIADGKSSLFVPSGLKDGPLPVHYEPVESPLRNPIHAQQDNPVAKKWDRPSNRYHPPADPRHPHAFTTYRLTEHHSGASPTRSVATLAELQPEGFAEIPVELARELGIETLVWVVLSTVRGEIETRALVTERLRPFEIDGRRVYQIGMPWHYGYKGYATGAIANELSSVVADPNSSIHEGKAFTCALRKGRLKQTAGGA